MIPSDRKTDQLIGQAIEFFQRGKLLKSKNILSNILKDDPLNFLALYILGLVYGGMENHRQAVVYLKRAVALNQYDASLLYNLANALIKIKHHSDAKSYLENVLSIDPSNSEAWMSLGICYIKTSDYPSALSAFNSAISINPNYFEAILNKGACLKNLGQFDEALKTYNYLISLKPDYAEAYLNMGVVFKEISQHELALEAHKKALIINSSLVDAWINLANTQQELSLMDEAKNAYRKALLLQPNSLLAKWGLTFSNIPVVSDDSISDENHLSNFEKELDSLEKWIAKYLPIDPYEAVGSSQPYHLAYLDQDHFRLLSKHGQLCSKLMNGWLNSQNSKLMPCKKNNKIQIAIISNHIRNHSVWHAISKGLIAKFNSRNFDLHIFHLSNIDDSETSFAKLNATSFTEGVISLESMIHLIQSKNIQVILYPEIGMHQLTSQLASLRLAPLQLASWGHPITSGFPNIDYFLSAELFEHSKDNFSENLLKLPNLGSFFLRKEINALPFDKNKYQLKSSEVIYICPGIPFKYSPNFDFIYPQIALKVGACKFIFFSQHAQWTKALKNRLSKQFSKIGLNFIDYVVFLPWLNKGEFYGLMLNADVYLDTIGFSGFNTALQAIECRLPIVTKQGQTLRSSLASGILKRIGMNHLITQTNEDYIDLAARLATDKDFRLRQKNKLMALSNILYEDMDPINFLENFISNKVN
jgi:predicted O-linked N-acetylglucosamine transferase (SPINDLY family)